MDLLNKRLNQQALFAFTEVPFQRSIAKKDDGSKVTALSNTKILQVLPKLETVIV